MTEQIDYERLAEEAFVTLSLAYHDPYSWEGVDDDERAAYVDAAMMVVAALAEQGLCVAPKADIDRAREYLADALNADTWDIPAVERMIERLAALAAPGDGGGK